LSPYFINQIHLIDQFTKELTDEGFMKNQSTRYTSAFIMEFISDFMSFCSNKYDLSHEEIAILCFIASESTRDIRNEMFLTKSYGYEQDAFPTGDRLPVSTKEIYTKLNLKRETTRKKLEKLCHYNYTKKVKGGYILPAQIGPDDYTKELRAFLVNRINVLSNYIKKTPE
jgi:hypothetical protein